MTQYVPNTNTNTNINPNPNPNPNPCSISFEQRLFKSVVYVMLQASCSVGSGPVREHVALNSKGQIPLIAHFLYMNQLQNTTQPAGMRLQRTETLTEEYP